MLGKAWIEIDISIGYFEEESVVVNAVRYTGVQEFWLGIALCGLVRLERIRRKREDLAFNGCDYMIWHWLGVVKIDVWDWAITFSLKEMDSLGWLVQVIPHIIYLEDVVRVKNC